jgi:phosphate transport system substrate-binding protein
VKRSLTLLVLGAVALGITGAPVLAQDSLRLTGSGATFPFPVYSAWFKAFGAKQKGVTVDYQGKGSGAGVQDFVNRTVDFAASDAAMTDEQMAKVPGGVQLLPMTAGEIVICLQRARGAEGFEADARRLSRDLPGQDHQVE